MGFTDPFPLFVKGAPVNFDFSLQFQNAVFSIVPSGLLLLLAPARYYLLQGQPKKIGGDMLMRSKLMVIFVLGGLRLAELVLASKQSHEMTPLAVSAATVSLASVVFMSILSPAEHAKSLRPSAVLTLYLLVSCVCDAVRTRSLWLAGNTSVAGIFLAAALVQVVLFTLESWGKREFALANMDYSPEAYAGFIDRLFFWWANGILRTGYKSVLVLEDLYQIEASLDANNTSIDFQREWKKVTLGFGLFSANRSYEGDKSNLWFSQRWTFLRVHNPETAWNAISLALEFAQPLLLTRTLAFLQDKASDNIGYGLIAAYGLLYVALALLRIATMTQNARVRVHMRGMLVSEIYDKALMIDLSSPSDFATATLMSTDVDRFSDCFDLINLIWSSIVQVALAVWLLDRQIGLICLVPIGVCLFITTITMKLSGLAGPRQAAWMGAITARISFTAEFLGILKVAKLTGLSATLAQRVQSPRNDEIRLGNHSRRLLCIIVTLAFSPDFLAPGVTFLAFFGLAASQHKEINVSTIFTALSLIMLMTSPLNSVIQNSPDIPASLACGSRIQHFLSSKSRSDTRKTPSGLQGQVRKDSESSLSINSSRPTGSNDVIVLLANTSFGWIGTDSTKNTALTGINLQFSKGGLHVVTGPIASGKSTLLKGLLGEAAQFEGITHVNETELAFCDQNVWLQNGTVRDNIIAYSKYDAKLYAAVVRAVSLVHDFNSWPLGDLTVVGSNGLALSGGQKRRIALARSLLACQKLYVLDDVFDGLDAATEARVAHNLFGVNGVLRSPDITSIVATHSRTVMAMAQTYIDESATNIADISNAEDKKMEAVPEGIAANSEDDLRKSGDWNMYAYYFAHAGRLSTIGFFILQIIAGFFLTFPSVWLKIWTEAPQTSETNNAKFVSIYFVLQLMAVVSVCLLCFARLSYLTETDVGVILNRFSQDIEMVDDHFPMALFNFCAGAVMSIGQMVLMAISTWYVAIGYPIITAFVFIIQRIYLRTSRQMRHLSLEAKAPIYTQFLETVQGLASIRAFGWTRQSKEEVMKRLNRSQQAAYLLPMIQLWLAVVLDLMVAGIAALVVGISVAMKHSVSIGFTAVALVSLINFGNMVKTLILSWTSTETSLGALVRIKGFTEQCKPENESEIAPIDPGTAWPQSGNIALRQYSATYKESAPNALQNVSLSIPAGAKVAVCGRTGSGKSTLITSLLRFVRVTSGSIEVDGVDLDTVDRDTVRSRFVVVSQDVCLVKLSIRFNIDPHDEHTDEEIGGAIDRVGLSEAVGRLGGLDTELSTDSLSHGQKQLLGLARASLKPGKIVILDEATSGVDGETEKAMQAVIDKEFDGRTILAVTHHLQTIEDYDIVILMKSGVLEDMGKPGELLARNAGFREMYARSVETH
ncbi:hypothetical protein NLG97_g4340 [Lecanicillium saksenae]|uniref:Uncharacterized protein n=1 Tax=Lecanicillium saksenae TaxID=468837 RepID=A0ACC1QX93_9HYPO|nr:hypothetical protein NLG97_g4340 [Lecanicillium saksenae]